MPPVNQHPTLETRYSPALTADTADTRDFAGVFASVPFPYRRSLYVDNSRGAGVVTLRLANGGQTVRTVGIGGTLDLTDVGPIPAYTITSTATESAGVVAVYENGGLTEA